MNLKAMPGLVLNSKRRLKLDNGPTTWMHKRDQMNGCNDITNDDNLRSMKELEEKPKSRDDNGSEGENLNHRMRKPKGVADDSTRLTPQDDILKDCHDRVSMPFVANRLKEECYCCTKPIDEPVWRYNTMGFFPLHFGVFIYLFPCY
ncbi:hypothetical protein BAE44_0010385 [Dichanthelium oligosanthes]|uniref:Uncharacterized protein n=1 Tax=Dichanthelium oligosanthes TaxID=888268 RepID=A0A1E5VTZ8_9POAL|nr:hypothetical protein BAE44_0010385 [Dichanthelium oligosanthes]